MEQKPVGDTSGETGKQPEIILSPSATGGVSPAPDKVCPNCGTVNSPASVYCYKCGLKLPDATIQDKKICIGCRAPNSPTSEYCYKCGLKLPDKVGSENTIRYAGFWIRFVAYLIDGILLGIVANIISYIIIFSVFSPEEYMDLLSNLGTTGIPDSTFWEFFRLSLFASLAGLIVQIAYYTVAIGKWGRTVGKLALSLKVLKSDGSRVSYWRAFGRSLAYGLNGFTFGIGFLVIAFTQKKRGLHDYIADTIVIKTN